MLPLLATAVVAMKVCALCDRAIPPALESRHHLIPKLKGGKMTADNIVILHRPCHDKVHAVFTEAELARGYATISALRSHPDLAKFIRWISKRPIEFSDGTTSLRRRRQRGRGRAARMAMDGLEAESDSVGPGIYGGGVVCDEAGNVVIGQQYEQHNSLPGPVYDTSGYTELSQAIRSGPEAVQRLLEMHPELAHEITTGGATPLHVCGMSRTGELSTRLILQARGAGGANADVDAVDTWGYTALQRHATHDLAVGAQALLEAGASHTRPSGLEGAVQRDSARALARRLRSYGVLKLFQQFELWQGIPLPDDEIEL